MSDLIKFAFKMKERAAHYVLVIHIKSYIHSK